MALSPPRPANVDASLVRGRSRLRIVAVTFAIAFGSIALRLIDMVDLADKGQPMPVAQEETAEPAIPPPEAVAIDGERAEITDRNGVVLATNMRVPGVHADPSQLVDKAAAARQLAAILPGVDAAELQQRLRQDGGSRGSSTGSRRRSRRPCWSSACPASSSAWPTSGSTPRNGWPAT